MAEDKKKNEETIEEVVVEHSSMKKEKKKKKKKKNEEKNRKITEIFAGEDREVAAPETEKLGDDAKKKRVNSEAENVAKKSKKKFKEKCVDSEAHDDNREKKSKKKNEEKRTDSEIEVAVKKSKKKNEVKRTDSESEDAVKQSKKENKEKKADSETEDVVKQSKKKKSKRESGGDEIGNSESSKVDEGTKRKRDDSDLGAEENTESSNKEMKRKSKKKKSSVDSEVEENSFNSVKDAKTKSKEKNQTEDPVVEENSFNSTKDAEKKGKKKKQSEGLEPEDNNDGTKVAKKKKQSEDPELEGNNKDSTNDAETKQNENSEAEENNSDATKVAKKKGKKKKQSEAEENNNGGGTKDAKKKRKKQNSTDVPTPSSKSAKKVKFSDQVEIFPAEDKESEGEEEEEEAVEVVRGKRFTKEEDELIRKAVLDYIDNHALGDEGLDMILDCKSHPQVKGCWKEITAALPWRAYYGVYNRAHTIFEAGSSKGIWTKEDLELVVEYQKKHGNDWRALADAMGKNRKHVKDAWRRIRLTSRNKGHWSREEYQSLFDLVNTDLRMKAFQEKHSKHGMLRDNIPWMAISDRLGTRTHVDSCTKWYDKLMSPMVAEGVWANVDDYRLLDELTSLDAACIDDVDWDTLLENRDGEACRKRWDQMVHQIGLPGAKTFAEQVEILSQRYCPELAEDREDFDNRPYDPED